MSEHTPGPWADDKLDVSIDLWDSPVAVISGADGNIVAFVPRNVKANARAIAATPDLLNAAEQALSDLQWIQDLSGGWNTDLRSSILLLEHAINTAYGEGG